MKKAKNNHNKILSVCFLTIVILILSGIIMSFKSSGTLFSRANLLVRNITFDDTSFKDTVLNSACAHLLYTALILLMAGNLPGTIVNGSFIAFKAFSLGAAIGIAVKVCAFKKALMVCFCVFMSNVFVFPLYIIMFLTNLRFYLRNIAVNSSIRLDGSREYFRYALKNSALFVMLLIVECLQSAVGMLVIGLFR